MRATREALAAAAGVPLGAIPTPVEVRLHRWKYSRVLEGPGQLPGGGVWGGGRVALPEGALATAGVGGAPAAVLLEALPVPCAGAVRVAGAGPEEAGLEVTEEPTEAGAPEATVPCPPLLLAGDSFAGSEFAGCLRSADAGAALLAASAAFA